MVAKFAETTCNPKIKGHSFHILKDKEMQLSLFSARELSWKKKKTLIKTAE